MKCMCAQTRPPFILSSERVLGGMGFEPMLTPREKSPLPENFLRGGSNPRRCGQRTQTLPTLSLSLSLFLDPSLSLSLSVLLCLKGFFGGVFFFFFGCFFVLLCFAYSLILALSAQLYFVFIASTRLLHPVQTQALFKLHTLRLCRSQSV